ncbi:MAG: bifunctional phosphopantothenoylcysteine decarboxylase/phosphopantothenate--cysteine ligase CoaBC [Bacteroidales bacterium]|jgi:phosphopantothenoylcysteine decarboxylase/phosphopantothenate--cysteine ligase|nr:bifunctional phosphopantothenoylcysteine decarboxylase/phosphopantothenate--cysteine ligase CoaBC [Bacteroidales bacterium]
MLLNKNVLIGISGGIASYKTPLLIRELIKKGCNVRIVVTKNALEFVTLTTLKTLSQNEVYSDMFSKSETFTTEHISLSLWADLFIVAPATANIIGKFACGIADDCLSTSLLAFNKDIFLAPAMNDMMYSNIAVQNNINTLKQRGVKIISPQSGELACGTIGQGRMEETKNIVQIIENYYNSSLPLKDKTILITASSTQEKIDAVRYISNNSSGKMGFSLAENLAQLGAKVILISGKTFLEPIHKNIELHNVVSTEQMYEKTMEYFPQSNAAILSAAPCDYKPLTIYENKIKKSDKELTITLVPTKDILKHLGEIKKENQILVGFALETDNEIENAKSKLKNKNLDFIVLNSLNDKGAGFFVDTNKVTIINKDLSIETFPLKSKMEVAKDITNKLISLFSKQ